MALGKRSNVIAATDTVPAGGMAGSADADQDNGFGPAPDTLKKFAHHLGTRAHDGDALVMYAGARLSGNVGNDMHYGDQP